MRTSIITPPCPAGGGGKAVIPCRYCSAPRFFCRFGTDCALFLPARLILAAQSSHSFHSFHSSSNRRPSAAVMPLRAYRTCCTYCAQAAQELLYLTGTAVRHDILPTGTDCALFYLHGLSWRRRCQTGRTSRTSQTGRTSNRRPIAAVTPQRVYRMCCIAGHA